MGSSIRIAALAAAALVAVAGSGQAVEPKHGGTLTYTFYPEPTALSTIATTAVPVSIVATKICESLLEYEGPALEPKPGLAESWTISDDKKTYTFKLRPGVKFHDGSPLTSEDVKFSVEQIVRPFHSRGGVYFRDLEGIETPDPETVVFKLKAPVPFFMKAFQPGETPIFPKHALEKYVGGGKEKVLNAAFWQNPICTGPFKLKEWKKGSYVILERNPDYWDKGLPYLDQIVLRVIPDGEARAIALENGEVDLAPSNAVPQADIARLAALPNLVKSNDGSEALGPLMWLEVNLRHKPLDDVKVRHAISMALDREKIVDIIWFGQGKPATGPIVSSNPVYYDKSLKPYVYDLDAANRLLDEAGYKRGPDGIRFKLTQNFLPYGESWVRLAEYVKQQLGKIGIAVETQSLDMGGWLKRVFTDWDHDFTSSFSHNYADPAIGVQRTYLSANIKQGVSFNNSMGYRNPRVDELFRLADHEADVAKRKELYDEVQQILHKDMPVIYLIEIAYTHFWNKRVHGLITNGISMYSNWKEVWVE